MSAPNPNKKRTGKRRIKRHVAGEMQIIQHAYRGLLDAQQQLRVLVSELSGVPIHDTSEFLDYQEAIVPFLTRHNAKIVD